MLHVFPQKRRQPFEPSGRRLPGESLNERFEDLSATLVMGMALAGIGGFIIFIQITHPNLTLSITLLLTACGLIVTGVQLPKMIRLSRGARAERHVGILLQDLERSGMRVVHDIVADGFNIDHLVIAPQGLFAIETKFVSKLIGHNSKIIYRDGQLSFANKPLMGDFIGQAKMNASAVEKMLKSVNQNHPVKPVIIIPGWFIEGKPRSKNDPWVVNEKAFPKWLAHEPIKFTEDEVRTIDSHFRIVAERK